MKTSLIMGVSMVAFANSTKNGNSKSNSRGTNTKQKDKALNNRRCKNKINNEASILLSSSYFERV